MKGRERGISRIIWNHKLVVKTNLNLLSDFILIMLQFRPQYIISALLVYTPEQKDAYNQGNNTYIFLERKNIDTLFQVKFMLTSFAKPTNSGGKKK